jgi:hypothetical protein
MMVMAICCQVKVNKYSESVVQKGEVPKALHVIIDGKGQIIYEDKVLRETLPSEFCRNLMRPPENSPFKHGNKTIDQVCKESVIALKGQSSVSPKKKQSEEKAKGVAKHYVK